MQPRQCVLVAHLDKNLLLVAYLAKPAAMVSTILLMEAVMLYTISANVAKVANIQMVLKQLVTVYVLRVITLPGLALLFVFLLTPLYVLNALMEATLPLVPQNAHLVPVVPRRTVLEVVARSVLLVPSVLLTALEAAKNALLVLPPRLALIVAPLAALVHLLPVVPAQLLATLAL